MRKSFFVSIMLLVCIPMLAQQVDSVIITPNMCIGANSVSIEIFVSGGIPPYQFSWTGANDLSSDQQNIYGLYAGIYALVAKDSEGTVLTDPKSGLYLIEDPDPAYVDTIYIVVYQFTKVAEEVTFTDFPSVETLTVTNYGNFLMTDRVFNSAAIYNLIGLKIK